MFGWLKNKILRRHEEDLDYSDIRSGVLGRSDFDIREPVPESEFLRTPRPLEQRFAEPIALSAPYAEPIAIENGPPTLGVERNKDFDILDKLSLIESQLAAIRSQTETINERLKNLEVRLGYRRY
ncbi:MAG: hypothetical protein QXD48_03600 [Candidatus Aenigmatarchaeota archaeon]